MSIDKFASPEEGKDDSPARKVESLDIHVPQPDQYRMTSGMQEVYFQTQADLRSTIDRLGIQDGLSAFLSGFTRELRRHLTVEASRDLLRGFADSIPEVVKCDAPDDAHSSQSRSDSTSKISSLLEKSAFPRKKR